MTSCTSCGKTILFGGVTESTYRFCGDLCRQNGHLLIAAQSVPEANAEERAEKIRSLPCPVCGRNGPIDLHTSYWIWSFVLMTRSYGKARLACTSCARKDQATAIIASLLFGWWAIPWGVLTLVQVGRNIAAMFGSDHNYRPSNDLIRLARLQIAQGASEPAPGMMVFPPTQGIVPLVYVVCVLGGLGLGAFAVSRLPSSGSRNEPAALSLEIIERGGVPPQSHVLVGEHVRLYPFSAYRCRLYGSRERQSSGVQPSDSVEYALCPIVGITPDSVRCLELESKYGSMQAIPDTETLPSLGIPIVWVRTEEFRSVRDIPKKCARRDSLRGCVTTRGLTDEEWSQVQGIAPELSRSSVVVLEEGASPPSRSASYAMIAFAFVLLCVPLAVFLLRPRPAPR